MATFLSSLPRHRRPTLAGPCRALFALALGLACTLASGATAAAAAAATPPARFGFEDVAARAGQLALAPHVPPAQVASPALKALSYDQYRDIRFRPDRALWRDRGLPFEVMFFHLGKFNLEPVRINEVSPQGDVREVRFDRADFDYGGNALPADALGDGQGAAALGHAGFRVHFPLNDPRYRDEVIVFLGASYLRALGAGQRYGLSARGLAVDTAGAPREEFPRFTEFWLERPLPGATTLVVHALLDSPSMTGAYRFEVRPGSETVVEVRSRLYLRRSVATLGIAPLTSMFMFGENQPHRTDFRPEVHDSDGLMLATDSGEWIWRPLVNPSRPLVTSFEASRLRGFGLMQRDRRFDSYEDVEARYELRPSLWIEPIGDWGPGRVELLQLPTPDETHDNVVAYWVPARVPAPGRPIDFAYTMRWQGAQQQRPPGAWVAQTRTGRGFDRLADDEHQFIVDFAGPAIDGLPVGAQVEAVVSTDGNGELLHANAYRNDATGAWRMAVRVRQRNAAQPVELRGYLRHGNHTLSETWSNLIPPR